MKKILKWFGLAVALVIIVVVSMIIYRPETSESWVKPGIAQEKIPAGIETSVVFENVTVIPMDSERVMETNCPC